jgi:hypothetical protein
VLISQIRWSEATNRLGLFLYTDDGYLRHDANPVPSSDGLSTLEVPAEVRSGTYAIVVRFEQSNRGGPPGADDSQAFELTTSFR